MTAQATEFQRLASQRLLPRALRTEGCAESTRAVPEGEVGKHRGDGPAVFGPCIVSGREAIEEGVEA